MPDIATHVTSYDATPRDLALNDRSRSRGSMTKAERAAAECTTNMGNGITAVTYVDNLTPHTLPEA